LVHQKTLFPTGGTTEGRYWFNSSTVLRFTRKPFKSTSWAYLTTVAVNDNQTRVHWGFTGKMKYPTNLTMLFMHMEKMVGGDLEKGLQNLKVLMEK
jgi:hypothetical protein